MIVDFSKDTAPSSPLALTDSSTPISIVDFHFLGTTITQDVRWEPTICSLIKKAQQRMFFLRQLRKLKLPTKMLVQFYTAIIESILTSSITVWFPGATERDKHRLQRIVHAAEKVIGCELPSLQDLFTFGTRRRVGRITADPSHPGHGLFTPLPSGRRLRSIQTHKSRHLNSFFPSAIRLMNEKTSLCSLVTDSWMYLHFHCVVSPHLDPLLSRITLYHFIRLHICKYNPAVVQCQIVVVLPCVTFIVSYLFNIFYTSPYSLIVFYLIFYLNSVLYVLCCTFESRKFLVVNLFSNHGNKTYSDSDSKAEEGSFRSFFTTQCCSPVQFFSGTPSAHLQSEARSCHRSLDIPASP
uniref:Alkylated DNA repair protein AlkB homologue 8 N-terminal domain-containing protein n=1 Tax=Neogobius melanostomus TaxID=47308 RepID=A0A8C6U427_9GOBI